MTVHRLQPIYHVMQVEIYGDLAFDQNHVCAAEFDEELANQEKSNIAVVAGVSKSNHFHTIALTVSNPLILRLCNDRLSRRMDKMQ
jgi:hypothetical protein